MERGDWIEARLDDRFNQIDHRFDRLDAELRGIRTDLNDLKAILIRFNAGIMVGLLGVIAAILARGV
jgi:hypothetical protein